MTWILQLPILCATAFLCFWGGKAVFDCIRDRMAARVRTPTVSQKSPVQSRAYVVASHHHGTQAHP